MKIIFSRKGLRSEDGGVPSPIFPDNSFCLLPFLSKKDGPSFKQLKSNDLSLGWILEQLSNRKLSGSAPADINPDIDRELLPREPGWRPTLRVSAESQAHLESQHIKPGDLFLFYSSFREVLNKDGNLRYRKEMPERHCLYGWMQVSACEKAGEDTLYIATPQLKILGVRRQLPGGGVFQFMERSRILTAREGEDIGTWGLPHWMYPASRGRPPLSHHTDKARWSRAGHELHLKTAQRNSEFVFSADFYPEANTWLKSLFEYAETR